MVRLILLIVVLLVSLLAIFGAPAYHLWLLAIGVTEYPLIFVAIAALLTASGHWVTSHKALGTAIGIISIFIFLSPLIRAYMIGSALQKQMSEAFTGNGRPPIFPAREPFLLSGLLKSSHAADHQTYTFAEHSGYKLKLDYYQTSKAAPCVIVVHGGSWSSGDSQQLPELNGYLAFRGYNVASINYRMAPQYHTPAPVEDVREAIDYLSINSQKLNIDTNNIILLGRSAGAQIALLAAYTLHDKRIKGVVDFYGPADMVWGYSIPSNPLIMDSRKVMEDYVGGTYQKAPTKFIASSPLEFVTDSVPPTLIIHGENDVLVSPEHSRRLTAKLAQHNVRHYYLNLPWATHGFDFNLNGPGGQLSTYAVETFLNTVTAP